MTVNGLWSALESSQCGKRVGAVELQSKTLAIDLSIWICEGLTSSLAKYHASPALYLVFSRVAALLKLGVAPIICVEGKKRTGGTIVSQTQRRPHEFSKACKECAKVMSYIGCQVIHAEFEAEALCASLCSKGLVDGVITNDGDALIYGAQCIYTNFTLEGLSRSTIIRYNAADLKVLLPSNDESNAAASVPRQSSLSMSMEREDLIAFALLTGSDLAGEGVPHVGPKKALQLLHGCKTSLITECPLAIMSTWREQSSNEDDAFDSQTQRRCTICLHPGDCRQHKAKGCMLCGTSENQPCIPVSEKDKFRRKICKKTKMLESFAGQEIIDAYLQKDVQQKHRICPPSRPRLDEINRSQIIVSGRSQESSQAFVIKVVSRLLARFDLINCKRISPTTGTKLVAQRISKALVHKGYPCYEIQWFIPDFEFYFSSFEWQKVAVAPLSNLVEEFKKRERQIFQRKNDDNRIVMFTGVDVSGKQRTKKASRKRTRVFGRNLTSNTMNITDSEKSSKKQGRKTKRAVSMDISMLLHSVDIGNKKKSSNRKDLDLDEDNSTLSSKSKSEILENHDNDDTNYTGGTESRALEIINNNESSYYSPLPSTFTVYESPESIAMSSLEKNKIHHDSPKMPTLGRHGIGVTVKLGIPVKLSPIVVRHRSIFGDHDTIVS